MILMIFEIGSNQTPNSKKRKKEKQTNKQANKISKQNTPDP